MTILGTVGIADKGTYNPATPYKKGNFVLYNGSSWLVLQDELTGITPVDDGVNWKYLARGFLTELLSEISATDTSGLLGTAGATVNGQTLMDKIADMVADKLVLKTAISNQQVNDTTTVTGSALSYAMNQTITSQGTNLSSLSTDMTSVKSRLIIGGTGFTAIQAQTGNTVYRLYLDTNGSLLIYKSTDGGSTFPTSRSLNAAF